MPKTDEHGDPVSQEPTISVEEVFGEVGTSDLVPWYQLVDLDAPARLPSHAERVEAYLEQAVFVQLAIAARVERMQEEQEQTRKAVERLTEVQERQAKEAARAIRQGKARDSKGGSTRG